jgi:hypothetical protein
MRRRSLVVTGCGVAALLAASLSWGQIFKCPVGGAQVYQQSPCDGLGASGGQLIVSANGQKVVAAPRDEAPAQQPRVLGKTRLRSPTPVTAKVAVK